MIRLATTIQERLGNNPRINNLIRKTSNIKFDLYGMNGTQPLWADNYIRAISQSKMGLNLSQGAPIKYYSSDRLTQLIGNGLLTFVDIKTLLSNFFNKLLSINYNPPKHYLLGQVQ